MEFFKERVIDLNTFDFKPKEIESFKKVFENFGPHMQRVKVMRFFPIPFYITSIHLNLFL